MANRTAKIQANQQKQKQKEFNEFKNACLNQLVQKNVELFSRKYDDGNIYEYVLINGSVKGYFKYDKGIVNFEEMKYPDYPEVVKDVVSSEG